MKSQPNRSVMRHPQDDLLIVYALSLLAQEHTERRTKICFIENEVRRRDRGVYQGETGLFHRYSVRTVLTGGLPART